MDEKRDKYLLHRLQLEDRAEVDERTRLYLTPKRMVWETNTQNSASLLEHKSKQISLHGDALCKLCNQGTNAAILLDFGQEMHGGLEFSVQKITGARQVQLRIRFGESAAEAMSELGNGTHATNDHAIRDCILQVQELSMNPVGETGFRFARLDLLTPNTSVYIQCPAGCQQRGTHLHL